MAETTSTDLAVNRRRIPLTAPSLPASISPVLRFAMRPAWLNEESWILVADPGWPVPAMPAEALAAATAAIAGYEAWLTPADPGWLVEELAALYARWYVAELDPVLHGRVLTETVDALADQPGWAIRQACREWIAERATKPQAAHLVRRCRELTGTARSELALLRRLVDPAEQAAARAREAEAWQPPSEADKRRVDELVAPIVGEAAPPGGERPIEPAPMNAADRRRIEAELAERRARVGVIPLPGEAEMAP